MKKYQVILFVIVAIFTLSLSTPSVRAEWSSEDHTGLPNHDCRLHSSAFHSYNFLLSLDGDFICIEKFYEWALPLYTARTSSYDECTVNLYTIINQFDISRELFQYLLDTRNQSTTRHYNLDILFSGDRALIEAYYCASNSSLHNQLGRESQHRRSLERIAELQLIVDANTSNMSRHFHDIWTFASFIAFAEPTYRWMQRLVDAGEYERVNIVELVNNPPTRIIRTGFERLMQNTNLHLFTHYNLDIIYSGDWDLILAYYAIENQPLHDAQVQAAFNRHVAIHGMPDISWQLNVAETAPTLRVRIDGQFVHIPANEQQPLISNGRTLVPFRIVMEALGFTVSWDGQARTASLAKTGYDISVQLGNTFMLVNGTPVTLDVPAQSMNGRTMVPLRALSEATGMQVRWDGGNFIVEITTGAN